MPSPFRLYPTVEYHLRFQIVPGLEYAIEPLVAFCSRHRIPEVALFIGAEEWNNGLLTPEDEARWCKTICQAKVALEAVGVSVSLNPWMTVLHTDRGRTMPDILGFHRMVSPSGMQAKACASFGDPRFVDYVAKLYGRFASMGFRLLWIEDDVRFRNHAPLDWGGGFEDCILERFSKLIGRSVARSEVVAALLQAGTPHPWRSQWIELWGKLHREMLSAIAVEVKKQGHGAVSLGLMSSLPPFHSLEGRDWHQLFEAMEIDGRAAHRPNFTSYSDLPTRYHSTPMQLLDLQCCFRKAAYEVAPEIENFQFTRWSKSHSQTWVDFTLSAFYGADALLLDLFSFCGNSVDGDPEIGPLLDNSRAALDWISARFEKDDHRQGFSVYWRQDAAKRLRVSEGSEHLSALTPIPFTSGDAIMRYGIPVTYSKVGQPHLLSGEMAWLPDDSEIPLLIQDGLLLDGLAAEILVERGFGASIGIREIEVLDREESNFSLERHLKALEGLDAGYLLSINLVPQLAKITPIEDVEVWSEILLSDGAQMGSPCAFSYSSPQGGRVVVSAVARFHLLNGNHQRCAQMHAWLDFLNMGCPIYRITGGPYLYPIQTRRDDVVRVVVFNGSHDPASPKIHGIPEGSRVTISLLTPLNTPVSVQQCSTGEPLTAPFNVPVLAYVVFEFERPHAP